MTEFVLSIDTRKFSSTNALWNDLMLNDPLSVGYVSTLIALQQFATKEDWEQFYYKTGAEREALLANLDLESQGILRDERMIRTNKAKVLKLSQDHSNINTQHGRTIEELRKKGEILYENLNPKGRLTKDECFECVRYRVICETWNGIIIRERNTIEAMKKKCVGVEFRSVSGEVDYTYAVDYEVYKKNKLICGIQIKPKSYTWNAPYIQSAKRANEKKNASYTEQFKVPVITIISDTKGTILNAEALNTLLRVVSV